MHIADHNKRLPGCFTEHQGQYTNPGLTKNLWNERSIHFKLNLWVLLIRLA